MSDGLMCTTAMCASAKVQLATMQDVYRQYGDKDDFAGRFKPSVDALQKSFDDNYSIWSEWVPFNPTCCALQDIGNQAEELTNQMLTYVGAAELPVTPGTKPVDWNSVVIVGGIIVSVILLGPYIQRRA